MGLDRREFSRNQNALGQSRERVRSGPHSCESYARSPSVLGRELELASNQPA